MPEVALVLGSSGRFGKHMAEALEAAGWQVRRFDRKADSLATSAAGADVIVNGWNPPYTAWAEDVPRYTGEVIVAAHKSDATVLIPGNVYVFGEGSEPTLGLDTPHNATNPLGRIRIAMEAAYREAGVRTILLRAGDFLDNAASENWFDRIIAAQAGKGRIVAPGDPAAPHTWAYLPDLARAALALIERRETLDVYEDIPFPGYTLSIDQVAALVAEASGRAQQAKRMNWLPLRLAAPFWPMGRKLIEMRYLWSMPHELEARRFTELLPDFTPTDPLTAIGAAVAHLDIEPDQPVT